MSEGSSVEAAQIALEGMIQRALRSTRFTQDSPVLPDVWIAYGLRDGAQDLLLTPHWQSGAVALAGALYTRLRGGPGRADGAEPARAAAIATTQSTVAASLTLAELVAAALPLSRWWHEYLLEPANGAPAGDLLALWRDPATQPNLRDALLAELDALGSPALARGLPRSLVSGREVTAQDRRARRITGDLVWLVEVAGTLARVAAARADGGAPLGSGGAAAMTAELWATLNAKMMTYLQSITLETLVSEQRARGVEVERKPARRGIYKQPQSEPVRPTTPNSVFALGGLLLSGR